MSTLPTTPDVIELSPAPGTMTRTPWREGIFWLVAAGVMLFIGILKGILILSSANAAVDLHVLDGLHEQGNTLDILRCLPQPVNDGDYLRSLALLATTQVKLKPVEEQYAGKTIVGYRFPEDDSYPVRIDLRDRIEVRQIIVVVIGPVD